MTVFFREWLFTFERKLVVKSNQHSQYSSRPWNYATFNLKLFFTFVFQLSSVSCCSCTTCESYLYKVTS